MMSRWHLHSAVAHVSKDPTGPMIVSCSDGLRRFRKKVTALQRHASLSEADDVSGQGSVLGLFLIQLLRKTRNPTTIRFT